MGVWDETKERQFLMAIIHVQSVSAPDWNAIAKLMESTGDGFSGNALRQKFDKMKKAAKEEFGELPADNGNDGAATPKKTPVKRGKNANPDSVVKSTGKRKAGKKAADEDVASAATKSEDEPEESPTKKLKTEEAVDGEDENVGLV